MNKAFHSHHVYIGYNNRKSLIDIQLPENYSGQLVLFIHGFMGYMDWGCWNLMQTYFLDAGYGFVRYNASHNGTTIEHPTEFMDLTAFAENTYSAELFDLHQVIDFIDKQQVGFQALHLVGHSRGGGIALLAGNHPKVISISTLAAISSIEHRFPTGDELAKWRVEGKRHILNGRTQQQMPLNYYQYKDFLENKDQLSIEKSCRDIHKPTCIIHGDQDTSVLVTEGKELANWLNNKLHIIQGADHTFGSKEPWNSSELPSDLKMACETLLNFLNSLSQ
jgi:pimeloyl-ACP methyl ester carboxylesterase